ATETEWDGSAPPPGVYFHWYEPSFYVGFAPRTQDPERVHIELGRGNQVRVTAVLGDRELDTYASDLVERREIYRELIDRGVITLTTNKQYERFTARLDEVGAASVAASHDRERAVELLEALNPDRVFRIRMPLDQVAQRWRGVLASVDSAASDGARLDIANAVLPGRVNLTALSPELEAMLARAAEAARQRDGGALPDLSAAFIEKATGGIYRVKDGVVQAVELTAVYPAGTIDATTTYRGERLPDFGVTGVWNLIPRTQGRGLLGMVDYLSPNPGYGFISMLPYQHASGITYNAFHNAGVRSQLNSTRFLPAAWRNVPSERDGKPYQNLWVVSRAPVSHGCTRLPSGHMSELRQIVPSESSGLEHVRTFRNLPGCYDVFDVRGDGMRSVIGVQYYIAYKCDSEHTPLRSYVANRRDPYYRWLYGANVELGPVGKVTLHQVPVCHFTGGKAREAQTLSDVPLYEAPYEPEAIQFYTVRPVPFDSDKGMELNRELRKVGAGHALDRSKLLLD
ncbi:MAG TPA: hypothetical protein VMS55_02600, partial [Myxococcota bacterium]|nr:hypothetical protein [Myxococcota bacterium]